MADKYKAERTSNTQHASLYELAEIEKSSFAIFIHVLTTCANLGFQRLHSTILAASRSDEGDSCVQHKDIGKRVAGADYTIDDRELKNQNEALLQLINIMAGRLYQAPGCLLLKRVLLLRTCYVAQSSGHCLLTYRNAVIIALLN